MRVGINLLYLLPGVVGGTESYARGLLRGLGQIAPADQFFVFVNRESAHWPLPEMPNFQRVVCPVSARHRASRYLFEQWRLPRLLGDRSVDLVHSLGYVAPLFAPCASVVTVPDLAFRAFAFSESALPVRRPALELFVKWSALRSARVITLSGFSRREICEAFPPVSDRIVVTPLAPKPRAHSRLEHSFRPPLTEMPGIQPPYLVAFSSRYPNKNLGRLLEAFAEVRRQDAFSHQLVLVGHLPDGLPLPPGPGDGGLRCTGYLSDSDLEAVLAGADFLVFPSLYEGFGLPVLEAMAAGVPVTCSRAASLPEVAGDAALFFDPTSVEEMAGAIARMARDAMLRAELREKGYRNVQRFSWERTALATLQVYREVAHERGMSGQAQVAGRRR